LGYFGFTFHLYYPSLRPRAPFPQSQPICTIEFCFFFSPSYSVMPPPLLSPPVPSSKKLSTVVFFLEAPLPFPVYLQVGARSSFFQATRYVFFLISVSPAKSQCNSPGASFYKSRTGARPLVFQPVLSPPILLIKAWFFRFAEVSLFFPPPSLVGTFPTWAPSPPPPH